MIISSAATLPEGHAAYEVQRCVSILLKNVPCPDPSGGRLNDSNEFCIFITIEIMIRFTMRILLFIVPMLALTSCNKPSSLSPADKAKVQKEVETIMHDYFAAIRERGLTAEFEYLDSTEDFFWVPPGAPVALSYDSVRTLIEGNAVLFTTVNNSWDTLAVRPLSETLAAYTGKLRSTVKDKSGVETTSQLVESGVVIKKAGRWKLLSGQTTLLPEREQVP